MSTNFPTSLDDSTSIPVESAGTPLSTNHIASHTAVREAIIALETIIGITGSVVNTTFTFILSEITGGDKAVGKSAVQTLLSKTFGSGSKWGLGSDAVGDLHYTGASNVITRLGIGTNGYILKVVAGVPAWAAETVTNNASSTVAGIVEMATAAEITAGTAAGGTGALLAIGPDQLALSTPVFNGSGLTNTVQGFLAASVSNNSVTNTTTETDLFVQAIAANIIGTNKAIRFRCAIQLSWSGNGSYVDLRIKFGGSTLWTIRYDPAAPASQTGTLILEGVIQGAGATNSQEWNMQANITGMSDPSALATLIQNNVGTSAIDTTASQDLVISAQWENASSNLTATILHYLVQKIV